MAEPSFPTATPAAKFAKITAESISFFAARAYPSAAITVSPAPVTSNTSLATVGCDLN